MNLYQKEIDGRVEVKPRNRIVIRKDGRQYFNPSHERLLEDGWVEFTPKVSTNSEEYLAIQQAKETLANTDYKVIKCIEAYLMNEPYPYDFSELHRDRDEMRKIINEMEEIIKHK